MRNVLAGIACLLSAGSLFAQCTQPNLLISGIQGDMVSPCDGGIAFTSASFTVTGGTGATGSGAGAQSGGGKLRISKVPDKATNGLMNYCMNSKLIQQVKLTEPNTTITFQNALIASVTDNFGNPSSEAVEIKYAKMTMNTGGGNQVSGNLMGTARASSASIAAVNGDGHAQPVQSFTLTVRPGSTTFNNVQLAPPPPGSASRATILKPGGTGGAAPTESLSLNYGKIQVKYGNQTSEFPFTGGTLVNGNLRVSKASFTGPVTVAVHP